MIEIEKPQIECTETPGDDSYGKYVIEPLERGYGTTLGNALRRIMLSSLPGTAATSIKIAGVQHEFTTIPGVKEDVTEIVLNIKQLITKLHSEGTKTVFIEAVGPCEVTAGDIKSDGEVEVLNPDLHIATLGKNRLRRLSHGAPQLQVDLLQPGNLPIGLRQMPQIFRFPVCSGLGQTLPGSLYHFRTVCHCYPSCSILLMAACSSASNCRSPPLLPGLRSPARTSAPVRKPASCQRVKILFMYAQLRPPVLRQVRS